MHAMALSKAQTRAPISIQQLKDDNVDDISSFLPAFEDFIRFTSTCRRFYEGRAILIAKQVLRNHSPEASTADLLRQLCELLESSSAPAPKFLNNLAQRLVEDVVSLADIRDWIAFIISKNDHLGTFLPLLLEEV